MALSKVWMRRAISATAGVALVGILGIGLLNAANPGATKGRIPDEAISNGRVNPALVPDFIPAVDQKGTLVGWVSKKIAVEGEGDLDYIPVYADDLQTVVGHMYAGVGFVPNGTNPALVSPPNGAPIAGPLASPPSE